MKVTITIHLEPTDTPWETRIDHAFNRVLEFTEELREAPRKHGKKNVTRCAFNRVVSNGEFTLEDAKHLCAYAVTVAERVTNKAKLYDEAQQTVFAAALRQAATNLVDTLAEFQAWAVHATQSIIGKL